MEHPSPAARLAELADRYWRFQCEEFPLNALLAGEQVAGATLFREAPADYDRRDRTAAALLAEVAALSPDALSGADRLTLDLMRDELEGLRRLYAVGAHLRPALLPLGPEFAATHFANTAAITDPTSAERFVERLATVPAFLADVETALREGAARGFRYPRVVIDAAVRAARGGLQGAPESMPWVGPFRRSPASGTERVKRFARDALAVIRDGLLPALARHADLLDGPLRDRARDSIACTDDPLGEEFYAAQVRRHTTTALSPSEIHELGISEVARLAGEMAAVAATAGFAGDLPGYRDFLARDPGLFASSKEDLRVACESLAKRIDRQIPGLFGRIPRMTYGIETLTEAASEHLPPAYAQPNPTDRTQAGIFWLTALPARCPTYMLVPLTLHEAWPGHLMHLALVQEMDELPAFRRNGALKYTACIEGWALYCESLGVEMGLYSTPHQHYGRLEMEMWRALRLVVDTGIHAHGWSRSRAIDTMLEHLALPRATVEGEVDRYIGLPGQALAYQLGNIAIRDLRRQAERQLGDRFDLRAFHDRLLAVGPVSLPALESSVTAWLDRAA